MSNFFKGSLAPLPKPKYKYITDNDEAKKAIDYLSRHPEVAFDTEGTSLDPFENRTTLMQLGTSSEAFVFDIRNDMGHTNVSVDTIKPILVDKSVLKIVQNAKYDMMMIKPQFGFYVENVYDTMLAEQLLHLGRGFIRASLGALMQRYLGMEMPKEAQSSFGDYYKKFEPWQLEYAANDVIPIHLIKQLQMYKIQEEKLEEALQLEHDFLKPMCEMELNGILIDTNKWKVIMNDVEKEKNELHSTICTELADTQDQTTLFGISNVNIDSNVQLKQSLEKYGLSLENTSEGELSRHKGLPLVDNILDYRKASKLISTYSDSLLEKVHPKTGRLHTNFRQMVATGRMSSSAPNLQNIPGKQKFRSCFIAKPGHTLVTADMSGAELRILGNLSEDPIFVNSYAEGLDLHTMAASKINNVPYDKVTQAQRKASKAIQFGLCYGLSKFGLAKRLEISEKEAEKMINDYFKAYKGVKRFLDSSAKDAVKEGYSVSVSGRRRYYNIPDWDSPERGTAIRRVGRQAMNSPMQSGNADTIKQAMVYLVDRLAELPYEARLCLTVHDEVIVEMPTEHRYEVAEITKQALIDGFGKYFSLIPMDTDALISPTWMKDSCENKVDGKTCGCCEMELIPDEKYGTKLVCKECGAGQD